MTASPVNSAPRSTPWTKSSFSTTGEGCVQVRATGNGHVIVGDTKNPDGPVLTVTNTDWTTFLDQVATGTSDYSGRLIPVFQPDGGFILRDTATQATLVFTRAEWDAFHAGVVHGELRPLAAL